MRVIGCEWQSAGLLTIATTPGAAQKRQWSSSSPLLVTRTGRCWHVVHIRYLPRRWHQRHLMFAYCSTKYLLQGNGMAEEEGGIRRILVISGLEPIC